LGAENIGRRWEEESGPFCQRVGPRKVKTKKKEIGGCRIRREERA